MRNASLALAVGVALSASQAFGNPVTVADYRQLPQLDQSRLVQTAYDSMNVALAFAGVERATGAPAGRTLAVCLKDRNTDWLTQAVNDYLSEAPYTPTSFGGAFVQAMAWKCGLLSFEKKK